MKKSALRLICAVLISVMVIPSAVFSSSAEDTSPTLMGREMLAGMPNGDSLTFAYDQFVKCVSEFSESIGVLDSEHSINEEEIGYAYTMASLDHPELFWFSGIRYSMKLDGTVISVYPGYTMSKAEAESAARTVEEVAERLCSGLYGLSDYEIALALHDRLADHTSYEFTDNDQTVYGALAEGQAVCAGYSAAYQYLMRKMGISTFTVTGASIDPSNGIPVAHAWNLVLLDGEYYYTDVTWDDQQASVDYIFHEYLNITSEKLLSDHEMASMFDGLLPECTATAANYFVQNDTVVNEYDMDGLYELFINNGFNVDIYIDGDVDSFIDSYYKNISELAKRLGIKGGFSYGYQPFINEVVLKLTPYSVPPMQVEIVLPEGTVGSVNVLIYSGDELISSAGAEANGGTASFTVAGIKPGDYTMEIKAPGYTTETVDFSFNGFSAAKVELHPQKIIGDVDGNGKVDAKDSAIIKNIIVGRLNAEELEQYASADLNGDGKINTRDVYLIKRIIVKGAIK